MVADDGFAMLSLSIFGRGIVSVGGLCGVARVEFQSAVVDIIETGQHSYCMLTRVK